MTAAIATMLLGWWSRIQGWALAAAAALAVLGAAYIRGGRQARRDAALRDTQEALRRREVRDAVDRDVAREPSPVERLREWTRD